MLWYTSSHLKSHILLFLSMLLISKSKDIWKILYVRLINCRLHLFRSSASSFSSQYLLFLKPSRSCVLLLPTPFTSVICPSMASWRRQFLLRIWPIQLAFLRRILFRSILFSPMVKNLFISYFLWPFYLLHSSPAPHFEALQIFLQFS